jgi:pSer/pThr/pTyr-binding forkhead associated (FHA) protein
MKKKSDTLKNNHSILPYIILSTVEGKEHKFPIDKDKIIIGRLNDINDISLQPDPQQLVTRYMHCSIEIKNCTSWIIDNASKNGTFLKRNNIIQKVKGEIRLQDNDKIMILGNIGSDETLKYWELLYKDPLATVNIENCTPVLIYDWIQAKLFINKEDKQTVINSLTPMEHKLLRYMDQRNKDNDNIPVMCTYDELISAFWDDGYSHTMNDVNHLVQGLRKKIEPNYKTPIFLVNIRGMGYRLISNP